MTEPHRQPDPAEAQTLARPVLPVEPELEQRSVEDRPWLVRVCLRVIGWIAVGLAILGVPLPLLPTTPFLLLAAACFLRSSPKLHQRLMENERLGPFLRRWREDRRVSHSAKRRAYAVVVLSFGLSIYAVEGAVLRASLAVGGLVLLLFLINLRSSED